MWDYLKKLFSVCDHEYKTIKEISMWNEHMSVQMPIGTKYVLQCCKCGEIKVKKDY